MVLVCGLDEKSFRNFDRENCIRYIVLKLFWVDGNICSIVYLFYWFIGSVRLFVIVVESVGYFEDRLFCC